jgi:BCD family chlorophyll transporter-like MFS transporter
MALHPAIGIVLAIAAFVLIGIGVGAAGTSLLVLLAKRVAPPRRAAAASIVWVTMIAGFVVTAGTASLLLEPFSFERLIDVSAGVSAAALVVSLAAIWGIEGHAPAAARTPAPARPAQATPFRVALAQVWQEKRARHFAIFVFVSMLGYSAQELILEPFGGAVFHLTPGETAKLTSVQHGGALIGMILVALAGSALGGGRLGSLRVWTLGGCAGSAAGLLALALAGFVGPAWPLQTTVFLLGAANGAFAVSAIGAMMGMAGDGRESREGVRMGLWGAAQAVAFALGGMLATIGSDVARHTMGSPVAAYAIVFAAEAALFLVAAQQAARVFQTAPGRHRHVLPDGAAGLSRG